MDEKPSTSVKIRLAILLGLLSMLYGEIFSGSSQFWFLEGWGLLVTFPLYTAHSLFYLNLALRTKRTSILQLYFWGILFALYEAPITKVLWTGYPGSTGPAWGLFFGVAIHEFIVLVFFWHPVMSFMMPILTIEIFLRNAPSGAAGIFPGHAAIFQWKPKNRVVFFGIMLIGSTTLSMNSRAYGNSSLLVFAGSLLLVLIAKAFVPFKTAKISLDSFLLGKGGFGIIIAFLVFLYTWTWFLIFPGKFPDISGIWFPILFAVSVCVVITKTQASPTVPPQEPSGPIQIESRVPSNQITTQRLYVMWGVFAGLLLLWDVIPDVCLIIGTVIFAIALPTIAIACIVHMVIILIRGNQNRSV